MVWLKQNNPQVIERAIAGLCYASGGFIGIIYIIISKNKTQSMFFRFHFMQAIVISILGVLLSMTSNITAQIVGGILGVFNNPEMAAQVVGVIALVISLVMKLGYVLLLYGMIWAFLGKYAEIPVISPLVRQNMR